MPRRTRIPTPRFNLRTHDAKERDTPILISLVMRYSHGRIVWSTKEKARPRFWDADKGRVKITVNNPQDAHINAILNDISTKAVEIYRKTDGEISVEDFKAELDYLTGRRKRDDEAEQMPLLAFVDHYLAKRKNDADAKRGTWKILQTIGEHLKMFAKERRAGQLDYDGIDWNFHHEFVQWLYSPPREHSTNYAAKVLSVVAQFLNEAQERGYHQNTTHQRKDWKIKKEKLNKQILSFDELDTLAAMDFSENPRLERVRDLFLIGAYSGLRWSDFSRIKPEHIVEFEGVKLIEMFNTKTNTQVAIPIMPALEAVLRKYSYHSPDKISNQKFNEYIKEVCQLAGITQKVLVKRTVGGKRTETETPKYELVSSHTARRSFATNFYQKGYPAIEIMKITGHATERQFMEYINIDKRANARSMAAKMAKLIQD